MAIWTIQVVSDDGAQLRSRVVTMLACLERAGVSPIAFNQVHAFVFFTDVLSPLWSIAPIRGSVRKDLEGPFYKEVQEVLDEFVTIGLVEIVSLAYREAGQGGAYLDATFRIALKRAEPIIEIIRALPDEAKAERYIQQLAFSFSEISSQRRDEAVEADATYAAGTDERVIDFAEWRKPEEADYSVRAARRLQAYAPEGVIFSDAEQLVLYMRFLKSKAGVS